MSLLDKKNRKNVSFEDLELTIKGAANLGLKDLLALKESVLQTVVLGLKKLKKFLFKKKEKFF